MRTQASTHVHQHIHADTDRCKIYSRTTRQSEKGAKWGLSPLNLASLIRRATAEGLSTPSSEPSPRGGETTVASGLTDPATRGGLGLNLKRE